MEVEVENHHGQRELVSQPAVNWRITSQKRDSMLGNRGLLSDKMSDLAVFPP